MAESNVDVIQEKRLDEALKHLKEMQEIYTPFTKPRIIINSNTEGLWRNNTSAFNKKDKPLHLLDQKNP